MTTKRQTPGARVLGKHQSAGISDWVILVSVFWLCIGNAIGLVLAVLLLFPSLNEVFAPYTYGRIVPLHLDFHLYGWLSVPLLGLLFRWFIVDDTAGIRRAKVVLGLWSITIAAGGISVLFGHSSGKLFLEWSPPMSYLFIGMLGTVWLILAISYLTRIANGTSESPLRFAFDWLIVAKLFALMFLAVVPLAFYFALNPTLYPPIDIASSGATGASLVISTLAIVALFLLVPIILGVAARKPTQQSNVYAALVIHVAVWAVMAHGNSSNSDWDQILGLSSLLIWVPLLWFYYRQLSWSAAELAWLKSFALWGSLLTTTAIVMFLPGYLRYAKFSNLLVAHSHLAMAGTVSSFMMVVLLVSARPEANRFTIESHGALAQRLPFYLWHVGLFVQLVSLGYLFYGECSEPGYIYHYSVSRSFGYGLRALSGASMLLASLYWLFGILKTFYRLQRTTSLQKNSGRTRRKRRRKIL